MNIIEIIAQDVFDKVRSRFTNLQMGDENGSITTDPKDARFFDFDFTIEGNNLGRVSISINERGTLKLYYGQGILEDSDPITASLWYDFLKEMRFFAKRRMLRFDTRDITKGNLNKTDFQYLATNGSKDTTMKESNMYGSSKSSYRKLENTRLIIRHSKAVNEEQPGSRSRNINALFIENAEGERFKYPFIHLAGAKAMQRHVANGGNPHDPAGKAIIGLSEKIAQLHAFKKHVGHRDFMNTEANHIIERSNMKLEALRKECDMLSRQGYYEQWKENFVPIEENFDIDPITMEDYKSKFTIKQFDEDLTTIFPLIHSIMQEAGTLELEDVVGENKEEYCDACDRPVEKCVCDEPKKEAFDAFESWANALAEGTLEPDTIAALKELLDSGLTLGVDGTSAIEALQGIGIHSEELEAALESLAKVNPETDPSSTIIAWLQKDDPEAAQQLGAGAPDATAPEPQAAPDQEIQPAGEPAPEEEPAMAEGSGVVELDGRVVDTRSLEIDGVHRSDYPDFSDAYFAYGEFEDGTPLSDEELDRLTDERGDLVNQMAHDSLHESAVGDTMTNKEPAQHKPNIKEIAEVVKSFYDKETGKFPRGETGVVTHCKKMFGDEGGALAERLVAHLTGQSEAIEQFESIKKLAGLKQEGFKDVAKKVGGAVKAGAKAVGKAIVGKDDDELIRDLQKKVGAPQHGKRSMAKPNESVAKEEFNVILKLAGLAK